MERATLIEAGRSLGACGALKRDNGDLVVPYPTKAFLLPMEITAGQGSVTFTKEITGETDWELRAIASSEGMGGLPLNVRVQIQLPSGRYLFGGNGIDASQLGWIGSYRYTIDPPVVCEPGDRFAVTLSDYGLAPGQVIDLTLVFDGVYRQYLRGPVPDEVADALRIPKYQNSLDSNVLAPVAASGALRAPYGDDYYIYSTAPNVGAGGAITGTPLALPTAAVTLTIPIDAGTDFCVRRLLVDLEADVTVTAGSVLGRVRLGSGDNLSDNFIDLAANLCGLEFPVDWRIPAGDSVFVDLALVDTAGTGNMYMQVHLEGFKTRVGG